jgi:hypothetical protein
MGGRLEPKITRFGVALRLPMFVYSHVNAVSASRAPCRQPNMTLFRSGGRKNVLSLGRFFLVVGPISSGIVFLEITRNRYVITDAGPLIP